MSMSSMPISSSSAPAYPPDHFAYSDHLCYVHCHSCDTFLAVSVPSSSLLKTVMVRCGHCGNLLSVNTRGLFLPPVPNQLHLPHSIFTSPPPPHLLEEMRMGRWNMNVMMSHRTTHPVPNESLVMPTRLGSLDFQDIPKPPPTPPEKRQRVPSAYNRFIKEEIQRIKAGNPDISHREAFSAAAKNWAHFPHIGVMPDLPHPPTKKANERHKEGEDVGLGRDGLYGSAANVGVTHH